MGKTNKKTTRNEKKHMNKVAELGCIACTGMGFPDSPAELHHISNGMMSKRASHFEVIPLCHFHHRTGGYGNALHAGIKVWEIAFGTEADLLKQVHSEVGYQP